MTLSNFDWTDKTSLKWFIILPTGHEGPYSLEAIEERCRQKKISPEVLIWSEGLPGPVVLKSVEKKEERVEEDELPPLPMEAFEDADELPPIPVSTQKLPDSEVPGPVETKRKSRTGLYITLFLFLLGVAALNQYIQMNEKFEIRRYPKMSLNLHDRIQKELTFGGWNKDIFFKEYVPVDMSTIWLVTSSFQECQVEVSFQSEKDKLISLNEEAAAFKSKGHLKDHVVELTTFDFTTGSKIIPGMYEADIKAYNCKWNSWTAKLANKFVPPKSEYTAKTKVILFNKGAAEFNTLLDTLIKKKLEIEMKGQNQKEAFWQDLQQKLQTLLAISLQIEQHLLDFLAKDPKSFASNLKPAVDLYTGQFGHFLTNFVVSNEEYFESLRTKGTENSADRKNYELLLKQTAKRIGLQSMQIIESLQKMKNPGPKQLPVVEAQVKKTFSALKEEINRKIIQISDDRSI